MLATFVFAGVRRQAPAAPHRADPQGLDVSPPWSPPAAASSATSASGPAAHDLFTRLRPRRAAPSRTPTCSARSSRAALIYMLHPGAGEPPARHDPAARRRRLPDAGRVPELLARRLDQSRRRAGDLSATSRMLTTTAQRSCALKFVALLAAGSVIAAGVVARGAQLRSSRRPVWRARQPRPSYDKGAEGRFGGQEKAVGLIVEHPLGHRRAASSRPPSPRGSRTTSI